MVTTVCIVWDYDTPIGQVNASLPYNFNYNAFMQEIDNVERILEFSEKFDLQMTFAVVGFAAENGHWPFNFCDQIAKISSLGHEIASHSWKHEWLPHLRNDQLRKTLTRSKKALENCIQKKVHGFVPPFSRPMSWYSRGALSLGDRSVSPWSLSADLGKLTNELRMLDYKWCRVTYQPIWWKLFAKLGYERDPLTWQRSKNIWYVPHHYTGFDERARDLLNWAIKYDEALVIVGHPNALSLPHSESLANFQEFLEIIENYRQHGKVAVSTVTHYLQEIECQNK